MSNSSKKSLSQQLFGTAAKKDSAPSLDGIQDDIIYTVEEDRGYLLSYTLLRLAGVFAALFFSLLMWAFANRSGNVIFLIAFIAGLTAAWFFAKGLGKKSGRLISRVPVISFGNENLFIFEKADKNRPLILKYGEINAYKIIRQGNTLRLLLEGPWVKHPSGFYLVSISRPFMKTTLSEIQTRIETIFNDTKVKEVTS